MKSSNSFRKRRKAKLRALQTKKQRRQNALMKSRRLIRLMSSKRENNLHVRPAKDSSASLDTSLTYTSQYNNLKKEFLTKGGKSKVTESVFTCVQKPTADKEVVEGDAWLSNDNIDDCLQGMASCTAPKKGVSAEEVKHINFVTIDFTKNQEEVVKVNKEGHAFYERLKNDPQYIPKEKHIVMAMNLDRATGPGFHWTAIYIYLDHEHDHRDSFFYYFDSAKTDTTSIPQGEKENETGKYKNYPDSVRGLYDVLHKKITDAYPGVEFRLEYNKTMHQKGENECGIYVIFVLYFLCFPLGEPISFPIYVIDPTTKVLKEISKDSLTFTTQKQKLKFLETYIIPDESIHKYRELFFKSPTTSSSKVVASASS